jgi:hypothetical protein
MSIRVHVESLVLEGLPLSPVERARLERALVAELTRSLGEGGSAKALGRHGAVPGLPAADIRVGANDGGASIGTQLARSMYGSLVRQESRGPQDAAGSHGLRK